MSIPLGRLAPRLAGIVYLPGVTSPQPCPDLAGAWIALVFYPGDFSVESPRELQQYAAIEDDLYAEGARLVAASTDSFWSHKAWFESNPLLAAVRYPVLADTSQRISRAYGVLSADGTATRATFLLDPGRVVRHSVLGARLIDHEPLDTLAALRALAADTG